MSFKVLFKLVVFLAVLFAMMYIGLHNQQPADFYFPVLNQKKYTTDAALIYFAMFAVGVLTGAILTVGSGPGGGRSAAPAKGGK